MGFGTVFGLIWTVLGRGLSGGGLADTADRLISRLGDLRNAETEVEKAEIERDIVQLKAVADLQKPSSSNMFSPMMIGQYLIVIPFGIWWGSIHIVSVLNKQLGTALVIDDLPAHIFSMAEWLIPLIIVGTLWERRK